MIGVGGAGGIFYDDGVSFVLFAEEFICSSRVEFVVLEADLDFIYFSVVVLCIEFDGGSALSELFDKHTVNNRWC